MKPVIETARLLLRPLLQSDSLFILDLLNDPDFIRFIADRGVRTPEQAAQYIANGPRKSYREHGFGLWMVEEKATGRPAGICGMLRRYYLEHPDIGYAFLPAFRGNGFAREAAAATLGWMFSMHPVPLVSALVHPENDRSMRLLETLGFQFQRPFLIPGETRPVHLFTCERPAVPH